eukprot:CAMPEP_0197518198 /NCGR_PEP_ID=MMETSP1318-20131121/3321_1 /TAXON_ID=552666 /ORGANISM="Partenskyella glossopodia, Strain RCC365" /LENGTH=568 /DNA_ID=CAMNT_0043068325 /DNA_START=308 /DNA_END=2014 /DNA_ORIENTATION=-
MAKSQDTDVELQSTISRDSRVGQGDAPRSPPSPAAAAAAAPDTKTEALVGQHAKSTDVKETRVDIPGSIQTSDNRMTFKSRTTGTFSRPHSSARKRRNSAFQAIGNAFTKGSAIGLANGGLLGKHAALHKSKCKRELFSPGSGANTTRTISSRRTMDQIAEIKEDMKGNCGDMDDYSIQRTILCLTITLCIIFFILKTFQPFILDLSRVNGTYPFRPSTTIWVSRLILLAFFSGWCLYQPEGLVWSRQAWREGLPYVFIAIFTVSNVLAIYLTIEYLGSAAYSVLKNLNIPFTAVLLVLWARKHISIVQWTVVIALTLALLIFRSSILDSSDPSMGYIFVIMGVIASSCEGILLQLTAADLQHMPFHQQSFFYHFYSTIFSTILMVAWDWDAVFSGPYGPFVGWDALVGVYIICIVPLVVIKHAVAGLASAVVVKLIVASTTVSSFALAVAYLGEGGSTVEILSCVQVCVLLVTYQMGGDLKQEVMDLEEEQTEVLAEIKKTQAQIRRLSIDYENIKAEKKAGGRPIKRMVSPVPEAPAAFEGADSNNSSARQRKKVFNPAQALPASY